MSMAKIMRAPFSGALPRNCSVHLLDVAVENQLEGISVVFVSFVSDVERDDDGISGGVVGEGDLAGGRIAVIVHSVGSEGTSLGGGVVAVGEVHVGNFLQAVFVTVLNEVKSNNVFGEREVSVAGVEAEAELEVQDDAFDAVTNHAVKSNGVVESVGPVGADKVGGTFDHHVFVSVVATVDGNDLFFFLTSGHSKQQGCGDEENLFFHF